MTQNLDLSTLELDNSSYIDEFLSDSFSDLVYSCRYKGQTVKISLLFEHKSSVPQHPHIQLLCYKLQIWKHQIKQKEALQVVVPVIFYHGKQPQRAYE